MNLSHLIQHGYAPLARGFTWRKRLPALALLLLFSSALLTACSFSLAEDIEPPAGSQQLRAENTLPAQPSGPKYPLVPPSPENGQPLYLEKCAPCHGEYGLGDGPQASQLPNPVAPLASADVARSATPADWYTQVTNGNLEKFMPPFASLSDRQRWDVVAYAMTLSASSEQIQIGAELYQQNCAACHGEQGNGDGPQAAGLSASPRPFTDQTRMAEISNSDLYNAISSGVESAMPAFAESLSDQQRWALAAYVRSLTFTSSEQASATEEASPAAPAETGAAPETTEEPTAAPENLGSIVGQVTHASGIQLPADLEITLRGFDSMQLVYTQTTTIEPDGAYQFSGIELAPGRAFVVTLEYEQAIYGSDIAMFEEGASSLELPVTVYDTTTDASILRADRLHLFFEFVDATQVRVIELYIISNPSDKTLVPPGEGQPSVTFTLPEGAENLEFQDGTLGGRFIETPGGFGDTASIRPGSGTYEALFAYTMPYDRKLDLKLAMPMPVDAVVILVPEGQMKLKSDQLVDGGVREVQEMKYNAYSTNGLDAGVELNMTITGKPSTVSVGFAQGSTTDLVIGLSVFGAALVVGGLWLYRRSRTSEDEGEDEQPEQEEEAVHNHPETIMDAIIALDDLYKAGELPEEAYQERRSELRERLKEALS